MRKMHWYRIDGCGGQLSSQAPRGRPGVDNDRSLFVAVPSSGSCSLCTLSDPSSAFSISSHTAKIPSPKLSREAYSMDTNVVWYYVGTGTTASGYK